MKTLLFLIISGLVIWMLIIAYGFLEKIGDHIGCSRETTHTLFWLSIAITTLNTVYERNEK